MTAPSDATQADGCPSREELERLAQSGSPVSELSSHILHCRRCADTVFSIRADNAFLDEFMDANRDRLGERDNAMSTPAGPDGYEITGELHRGAQGIVYEAIHHATHRHVALKMMLHGAFATAKQRHRFDRELELVAGLDHPNIVTVHDGGTGKDGRPYLVMELVQGRTLGEWIAEQPQRDIEATLELFDGILEGMAHAHRRGVIHRDLKPENIIIDEDGRARILDFGLAKPISDQSDTATVAQTIAGEFLGTFAYAAPEQIAADPSRIDTRTDIYALGGILYESLTGRRSHTLSGSLADVIDTILHTDPPAPRTWRQDLSNDLQAIILKALHKMPDDRYQSVHAFADDIRHYQAGEPVNALRGETWYWLRTTARRYRTAISVAGAMFVLIVGFTITSWILYLGKKEEAGKAYEAIESLVSVIAKTNPEDPDEPLPATTIVDLLDNTSNIVVERFEDFPAPLARVRSTLGEAYIGHSELDKAEEHLLAALALDRSRHRGNHPDLAHSLHNVGRVYWKYGRYEDAELFYRDALSMRQALYPAPHPDVAHTMHHLASTLRLAGRLSESLMYFNEAIAMRRSVQGDDHPSVGNTLNGLGNALFDLGEYRKALETYDDAFTRIPTDNGGVGFPTARVWHRQALCLIALGDVDRAESLLNQSLEIKRQTRDADHPDIADSHHGFALLHLAHGDAVQAGASVRLEMESRIAATLDDHPDFADALHLHGLVLIAQNELDDAEVALRRAIAICAEAGLRKSCWRVAAMHSALGECLLLGGNRADAEGLIRQADVTLKQTLSPGALPCVDSDRRLALLEVSGSDDDG